ncbi:CgeB family protein [Desmospora profundinema]|uniref:Spore maturation protein CgeB n=1 Tax=Desmospora profundinema TaxID=1571184 RepID=A0ABU1IL42_9BACL|nr:glycosyltransferase [Desmospora profundinema]MDR6225277.1 spore maturation protein CgeB [Desmospora profundinema]
MRLLYISSGKKTLSDLNPNMIHAFKQLEKKSDRFRFASFLLLRQPVKKLIKKIRSFQPDIILVFGHDNHVVFPHLKNIGVPVGLWVVNDPYNLSNYDWKARLYDFVITQESSCVSYYQKMGKPCIHSPLAADPRKYRPMNVPAKYRSDICFVGNGWPARVDFFNRLTPFLRRKQFILIGERWNRLTQYQKMKSHILKTTIPPSETAKYYNGAKIVLNIHRSYNDGNKNPLNLPAHTPNNRTFDIAACRAFQLLDYRRDLGRFYKIGEEIVCFKGMNDLKKKIDYYLIHEAERKKIASRSYHRTLKEHSYTARLRILLEELETHVVKRNR